jgi:glycerol transport system permease protein
VAFSAVIPLMTVVNYSVQDTFGNNEFFWAGTEWFEEIWTSDRFWDALAQPAVLLHHPRHRDPARHLHRAEHAAQGLGVPVCLVLMALPLLIPWNVVGTIWQVFGRVRHRPARPHAEQARHRLQLCPRSRFDAWITVIVMDVWHWTSLVVLLCYAGLVSIPDAYYQAARSTAPRAGRCSATSSCRR